VPRPLRFCHISIFYPPYSFGGDARYVHRLANALARRGHEVDVVHCADSYHALEPATPATVVPNLPGVTVHTLRSGWGRLSPLLSQQTGGTWLKTRPIREVLLSKKFDVIHYHNISLFGPKVLLLDPDYRDFVKLYTTHEHWLVCPMHVLWKNNERLCDKPECFRCALTYHRPPQWWRYSRLLERCTKAVDTFIAPSEFTRQMHREKGFQREMEVLPHFMPVVESEATASPHPRPFFLFVGRLEKIKGAQNLLPVFRDYPHADLLIIGTGTYQGELQRQAGSMSNVQFLGALPQEQVQAFYRHAIAVIVPSICYETFGLIMIEAFTERTPAIVHDLAGMRELAEESGAGFSYRTPEELLAAMERLRTDAGLRRDMGEKGYRKFLERWSEEAHLSHYFRIIEETARRKFGRIPWEASERDSTFQPASAGMRDQPL